MEDRHCQHPSDQPCYDYPDPGPGLLSRSGTRRRLSAQNMETYKYHKYTIGPTHAPPIPPTPPRTGRGHGPRLHNMNNSLQTCRPELAAIFRECLSGRYGDLLFLLLAFLSSHYAKQANRCFLMARSNIVRIKRNFVDISTTADLTLLQLECVLTFLW